MSDQSSSTPQQPSQQTPPVSNPSVPPSPPTPPLPISPYTGLPYDPSWGTVIQKGGGQPTIEQIPQTEFERKSGE